MRASRLRMSALAASLLTSLAGGKAADAAPPPVPVVRMAELDIDPAQLDAYKRILREEIEASVRIEPGVLSLNAIALKDRPASVRIMEIYADQAAYEAHIRSPHFLTYKTETAGMVRSLVLIEGDPVLLRAKSDGGDTTAAQTRR